LLEKDVKTFFPITRERERESERGGNLRREGKGKRECVKFSTGETLKGEELQRSFTFLSRLLRRPVVNFTNIL